MLVLTATVAIAGGLSAGSRTALRVHPASGVDLRASRFAVGPAVRVSRVRFHGVHHHNHAPLPSHPNPTAPTPTPPADTTPPQTSITSSPAASTTSTSANFSFSSSESGSTFACKLDSDAWASCGSPKSYSHLKIGSHQFSARATNAAGNVDPTPATSSWMVEATSPPPPPPPPPPSPDCTTVVSSVSAAQSSVSSASPGSVVCLADGSYGKLTLNATKAVPGVTIRAEHPGQATIDGASIQGARLTLASFKVTDEVVVQPGTTGIVIDHNRISGGYFGVDACASSSTTCNDEAIVGNQFVGPFGEDGIRANRYHDADGNGIGLLVEGNEFTKIAENGNHSDCLQTVWVGDHLVFRRNYLHDNRCQGFFVKDQASLGEPSGPVNGIAVEDNLLVRNQEPCAGVPSSDCGQPVYMHIFGPYTGLVVKHNTIWGDGATSLIGLREGVASDSVLDSNAIYRFWTDTNASAATLTNNTLCSIEGSWPSSRPGTTVDCKPAFQNPAADDYRLASGRGVDWAPAEQHYGP
jgi:hypothetical protein